MRKVFLIIVITILAASCVQPEYNKEEDRIRKAISDQVREYPASTLQDIYKSFFQDEFGPGHLVGDSAAAREYFNYELDQMKSRGRREAEPCGAEKNFVRVPMDLVKDSLICGDDYFMAFLRSSRSFKEPEIEQWKEDWKAIVRQVEKVDPGLPSFEQDRKILEDMLARGETMVHHSQSYSDAYDPHYRLMTRQEYERLRAAEK